VAAAVSELSYSDNELVQTWHALLRILMISYFYTSKQWFWHPFINWKDIIIQTNMS